MAGGQPGRAPGLIQSAAVGGTDTVSEHVLVDANFGFTRQRLGAENIDIDKNDGLDVLGIPGTNGPDRRQGVSALRHGRVPVSVMNLPHGVRVDDVGLNGVMITEQETSRVWSPPVRRSSRRCHWRMVHVC